MVPPLVERGRGAPSNDSWGRYRGKPRSRAQVRASSAMTLRACFSAGRRRSTLTRLSGGCHHLMTAVSMSLRLTSVAGLAQYDRKSRSCIQAVRCWSPSASSPKLAGRSWALHVPRDAAQP